MANRRWMMAFAGLALTLPAQAQETPKPQAQPVAPQAASGPLTALYRVAGVKDDGGSSPIGTATLFQCASYSAVPEKIRFVVRQYDGTVMKDVTVNVAARATYIVGTHSVKYVAPSFTGTDLNTGLIYGGGSASISATTTNMVCTAMAVDAGASVPNGIALHMQRFNPLSGTQE